MNSPLRRHALGLFSLLFLGFGVWMYVASGAESDDRAMMSSILIRAGLVMGALWLALPQIFELMTRQPPWLLGCVVIGLGVLIVRPRYLVVVGPILGGIIVLQFLGWLFKPLPHGKKTRPRPPAKNKTESNR